MDLKDRIIELYLGDRELSLRYFGVAKRLESGLDQTLNVLKELTDKGVMFKQAGYYQLNTYFLWEDESVKEKYEKRIIENSK